MLSKITKHAKSLRKRPTDVEAILWNKLRARQVEGVKFRRQQPIENFIVDFVSFEKRGSMLKTEIKTYRGIDFSRKMVLRY